MSVQPAAASASDLTTKRIESLSDGVFAVAMTLLIFNIQVPKLSATHPWTDLATAGTPTVMYVLSFIIAGVYWVGHHNQFYFINRMDRPLLWINIVFLMCVAFTPFSTALLGQTIAASYAASFAAGHPFPLLDPAEFARTRLAETVYGINLVVIGLLLNLHWRYAARDGRLLAAKIDARQINAITWRILRGPSLYVVAIIASLWNPVVTLPVYVIVPILSIAPGRVDQFWTRRAGRLGEQTAPAPREQAASVPAPAPSATPPSPSTTAPPASPAPETLETAP